MKTRVQHPGLPPVVSDWKEVHGDYAFAKYNKKVAMVMYNDEEYNSMLNDDLEWSREETNYLFGMCETFDLRFIVIADRYDFRGRKRTVEQLKVRSPRSWGAARPAGSVRACSAVHRELIRPPDAIAIARSQARYYTCARRLLEAREGIEEAHKKYVEVRQPYDAKHETQRKAALDFLLTRTPQQEVEDQKLLDAAAEIESRRTVEIAAVVNTVNGAGSLGAAAAADAAGAPAEDDVLVAVDGAGPAPPGVYLRGRHTRARIEAMLSTISGGAKTAQLLDKAIEGLGVSNLSMPTRSVCEVYVNLRKETAAMMELQKKVAMKEQELAVLRGVDISTIDPVMKRPAPEPKPEHVPAARGRPPKARLEAEAALAAARAGPREPPPAAVDPGGDAAGDADAGRAETPSSTRVGRDKKRKAPARYQSSPSPPKKRSGKRK